MEVKGSTLTLDLQPPCDDGLIKAEVSRHSVAKHHFLGRYVDAFTTSMKDKWGGGLHYIDLFAGAGLERVGEHEFHWGSPLIAAQVKPPFQRLYLCEQDKRKFEALKKRLQEFPQPDDPWLVCGDANQQVEQIVELVPARSLSLAFLDPYGFHLDYDTLRVLAQQRADLIIFFPDRLDALRNFWFYWDRPESNLDRAFGTSEWREIHDTTSPEKYPEALRELYKQQLRKLSYKYFAHERIRAAGGQPLYLLVFCSRHRVGLDIWHRVSLDKADGQRGFDFDR